MVCLSTNTVLSNVIKIWSFISLEPRVLLSSSVWGVKGGTIDAPLVWFESLRGGGGHNQAWWWWVSTNSVGCIIVMVIGYIIGAQMNFGVSTFPSLKTINTTMLKASSDLKCNSLWYHITNVADGECYGSTRSSCNDWFIKLKKHIEVALSVLEGKARGLRRAQFKFKCRD